MSSGRATRLSCGSTSHRALSGCWRCAAIPVAPDDPAHGVAARYWRGCRCLACKVAFAVHRGGPQAAARWAGASDGEPDVDWDALAHLRPGHGVRRRSA